MNEQRSIELTPIIDNVEGAKAGSGSSRKPTREPDSVATVAYLSVLYGLSEGVVQGFGKNWTTEDMKKRIYLAGTPIMAQDGTVLQDVDVDFRAGTIDQSALQGIPAVTVETPVDIEVRHGAPISRTFTRSEVSSFDVRINIPTLVRNTLEGDSYKSSITFAIDIAQESGSFEEYGVYTINEKISQGFQRTYNVKMPTGNSRSIRVRKITADATGDLERSSLVLEAITEITEVKLRYPHTALLWIRYDARNYSSIPKIEVLLDGKADILIPMNYDPETREYAKSGSGTTNGVWNGQYKIGYTDNPVWHWLDLATNKRYGLGNRITIDIPDRYYLYALAQYCDGLVDDGKGGKEPRFTCNNLYLQKQEDAFRVFKDLSSIFRAKTIWDGSHLKPRMDVPRDAMIVFSRANTSEVSYSSISDAAQHNVIAVQYYDTENMYKSKFAHARSVENIRKRGRVEEIEVTALGCVSEGQAQRAANYLLNTELTETDLITFTTGLDGLRPIIGDVFVFADDLLAGTATSGRVVSVNDVNVTLDREIDPTVYREGTFIVNTTENLASQRKIVAISEDRLTVTVDKAVTVVDITGLVWAVRSPSLGLREYVIDDLKYDADAHTFAVSGISYNRNKFIASDEAALIVSPPVTIIEPLIPEAPTTVLANYYMVVQQGINISNIDVSWTQSKKAAKYELEMRRDGGDWRLLGTLTSLSFTVENVYAGIYEFRVRAIDVQNTASPYGYTTPLNVNGKALPPPMITDFTVLPKQFGIAATWTFPPNTADSRSTRIRVSFQAQEGVPTNYEVYDVAYPTSDFELNGLQPHTFVYMQAALVDSYGNEGEYTSWANAQVAADPEALLEALNGHIGLAAITEELAKDIADGVAAKATADAAKQTADAAAEAAASASDAAIVANSTASLASSNADAAKVAASNATTVANAAHTAADKAVTDAIKATDDAIKAINETVKTNEALDAERAVRLSQVQELDDGLTQLSTKVVDGDSVLQTNIDNLKSSTDTSLSNIQTKLTTLTDADTAQASRTDAIDVRLTDLSGVVDSKASASALNSTNATVNRQGETLISHTSQLTALNSKIDTVDGSKLDADVITNYYTKTQADNKSAEIAAGQIAIYDASLVIGGTNLAKINSSDAWTDWLDFPSSLHYREFATGLELFVGDKITFSIVVEKSEDTSAAIHIHLGGSLYLGSSYLKDYGVIANNIVSGSRVIISFTVTESMLTGGYKYLVFRLRNERVTARLRFKELQVEHSTKVSDWSPSYANINDRLDANATAINTTNAEVGRINGVVTSHSTQLTNLNSSITRIDGAIATKADASAVNSLTTRVTNAEGVNTTQGTAITKLTNDLVITNTNLTKKADSSAVTALDSKVTQQGNDITSQGALITKLNNDLTLTNQEVSKKASAAALSALDTKVTEINGVVTSQGTSITSLKSSIDNAATGSNNLLRNSNLPIEYKGTDAYPHGIFSLTEPWEVGQTYTLLVKTSHARASGDTASILAIYAGGGNQSVYSTYNEMDKLHRVTFTKTSAGLAQAMHVYMLNRPAPNVMSTGTVHWAVLVKGDDVLADTWFPSSFELLADLNNVATATNSLTTKVTAIEGLNTTQSTQITNLNNTLTTLTTKVDTKADSSALNTLDSKVTSIDGRVTANSNSILSLSSRMTTTENSLTTKADSSALTNYYTKTQADSAIAGELAEFKSNLKIGGVNLIKNSSFDESLVGWFKNLGTTSIVPMQGLPQGLTHCMKIDSVGHGSGVYRGYSRKLTVGETATYSFWAKGAVGGEQMYMLLEAHSAAKVITLTTEMVRYEHTATVVNANSSATVYARSAGTMYVSCVQYERGSVASDWSEDPNDVADDINANATAITNTNTEVGRINGVVTSHSTQITNLTASITNLDGKINSKADATALSALDAKVVSIDGRVTSNTSALTSLNSKMATVENGLTTKADVSALNNIYTKSETDAKAASLAAGEVSKYNASLVIGGVNQLVNSESARSSSAASQREYLLYESSAHLKQFYDNNLGKDITVSFEILVPVAGTLQVYSSNGSAHIFSLATPWLAANTWTKVSVTGKPQAHTNTPNHPVSTLEFYGIYGTGRIPTVRKVQVEAGNKATDWSVSPRDTQAALDVNASAISTTNTEVARINGVVTGHSTQLTNLTASIAGKADSSALTSLTSRVAAEEGKSTAQATQLLNLNSSLSDTNANLTNNYYTKNVADDKTREISSGQITAFSASLGNSGVNMFGYAMSTLTNLTASTYGGSYFTVEHLAGEGVDGSNAYKIKTNNVSNVAYFYSGRSGWLSKATPAAEYIVSVYVKSPVAKQVRLRQTAFNSAGGALLHTVSKTVTVAANVWTRISIKYKSNTTDEYIGWAIYHNQDGAAVSANNYILVSRPMAELAYGISEEPSNWAEGGGVSSDVEAVADAINVLYSEVVAVDGKVTATSSSITQLNTTVSGHTTSIQQHTQSINGVNASYTVKINNNGYTTGFGLISTGSGGQPSTAFKVDADAFEVGKSGLGIKPFVVITSANQNVNGIVYPAAGTYINSAYIANATINNAHIKDLSVTTAKIADGQISTAKIGDLQVDTIKIKDNAITTLIDSTLPNAEPITKLATSMGKSPTQVELNAFTHTMMMKIPAVTGLRGSSRYVIFYRGWLFNRVEFDYSLGNIRDFPSYGLSVTISMYFGNTKSDGTGTFGPLLGRKSGIPIHAAQSGNYGDGVSIDASTTWQISEGVVDELGTLNIWHVATFTKSADSSTFNKPYIWQFRVGNTGARVFLMEFKK